MRIIAILFSFVILLFAQEKLIIMHFEGLNPYYYKHQIVHLTLKSITGENGIFRLNSDQNNTLITTSTDDNITYISHISFQLQNKFPTFFATLQDENSTILDEENITPNSSIETLNPPNNFCGVLANELNISQQVLSPYDDKNNIIYWTISSQNGNLNDFNITSLKEAKLYFVEKNNTYEKYSYSALVPKNKREFDIAYFNLKDNTYKNIKFDVKLRNESVSTQTDIKPINKTNLQLINVALIVILLIYLVLFIYKRKISYIILIILIGLSLWFLNKPKQTIILTQGTKIQILPFKNSTVFMVIGIDTKVTVLNKKDGYLKIKFNNHIGWVKDNNE